MPTKKTSSKKTIKKEDNQLFILRVDYPDTSSITNYVVGETTEKEVVDNFTKAQKSDGLFQTKIAVDADGKVIHYDSVKINHYVTLILPAKYIQSIRGFYNEKDI